MAEFDIEKFREVSRRAREIEGKIMAETARFGVGITAEAAANIVSMVRRHDREEEIETAGAHVEPGGVVRAEGYYHGPLEPAETAPFCDRCMGAHNPLDGCPEDQDEEDEEDDGEPRCTDPGGHSWVVRDDNEEISYCENCGADGNG